MDGKISVMDKVLAKLQSQEWTSREELEGMFPEKVEGHASWEQRLRDLRKPENGGYDIKCRKVEGSKKHFEWHIELPEPPKDEHSEALSQNNLAQETQINFRAVGKQLIFI